MKFVGYYMEANSRGDLTLERDMTDALLRSTNIRKGDLFALTQNTKGELVFVNCEEENIVTDD